MTDKLFCEVQRLAARKRRNEERIPREDLEGKYRKSYERLCLDLKEAQGQLRTAYTERILKISSVVAELPYIDFSQDAGKARLMERCADVREKYPDLFTKKLLIAVQDTVKALCEEGENHE